MDRITAHAPHIASVFNEDMRRRLAWATWLRRAGFDRVYGFHALTHTAVTNVYRTSRDLFLAQRFARNASPLNTTFYTHPSDEDPKERMNSLPS